MRLRARLRVKLKVRLKIRLRLRLRLRRRLRPRVWPRVRALVQRACGGRTRDVGTLHEQLQARPRRTHFLAQGELFLHA